MQMNPSSQRNKGNTLSALGRIRLENFSIGCDTAAGLIGRNTFGGPGRLGHCKWKRVSGKKEQVEAG